MASNEKSFKQAISRSTSTDVEPKLTCCHGNGARDGKRRNLVVCIDGTSNQFGDKNTNVIELYHLIMKDVTDNQRTWYNSGIGTYAQPSWKSLKFYRKIIYHKIDLAIAWNFEQTVLAAYRWLSDNYEPGDCIFLFGFSRGAYQVRVLSGMIDKVGLIYKGNEMQIPFAYELYADPESDKPSGSTRVGLPESKGPGTSKADRFKKAFSNKDVKVHFIGAWDTVSSIGFARGSHILPRTVDGMQHVCYFRHALALDERRVKFLPEYAHGGASKPHLGPENQDASPVNHHTSILSKDGLVANLTTPPESTEVADGLQAEMASTRTHPQVLEVWFAGTHSDIGGGNVENVGMDRSRPPLRWMVFEAGELGLRTMPFERELAVNEQIQIKESLTWHWWPLEICFFKRLTYTRREDGKQTTYKPHLGSSRKIHPGQKIHSSLILTDVPLEQYTPMARPVKDDPFFWKHLKVHTDPEMLELDLYKYAETLVKIIISEQSSNISTVVQNLRSTATRSVDGWQAVYEGVIGTLKATILELEVKYRLLQAALYVLRKNAHDGSVLKLCLTPEIRPSIAELSNNINQDYQKTAQQFIEQFTDPCVIILNGHSGWVRSVAFSSNGKKIVSGSSDDTIRIWDAETGMQVGAPFQGHRLSVHSVAFSPDGTRVVSGSLDNTIRMWDVGAGKQVGEPFQGHMSLVRSVAFSPEGKRIVSGSSDNSIRIWDVETGKQVGEPLGGHIATVTSVAFSPDGSRVVSGSEDRTIRIWDAKTGMRVGEPFQGDAGMVWSVAFSPDGTRIVSGSSDDTIRIWDAETGKPVGKPFEGHRWSVFSVSFSPDGKRIVSGSSDNSIRIWDVETGKQLADPFRGHGATVNSVKFSPDGRRIVSGSWDKTIRIWDVELW